MNITLNHDIQELNYVKPIKVQKQIQKSYKPDNDDDDGEEDFAFFRRAFRKIRRRRPSFRRAFRRIRRRITRRPSRRKAMMRRRAMMRRKKILMYKKKKAMMRKRAIMRKRAKATQSNNDSVVIKDPPINDKEIGDVNISNVDNNLGNSTYDPKVNIDVNVGGDISNNPKMPKIVWKEEFSPSFSQLSFPQTLFFLLIL